METENEEQKKPIQENKKGKSTIILTSFISSSITALLISSILVFTVVDSDETQSNNTTTQQTKVSSTNSNTKTTNVSNTTNTSIADMVESASKAIVGVVNYQEARQQSFFESPSSSENNQGSETVESGTGSGVIWKKENGKAYIITNNHVIEGATKVEISLYDGKKATAKVVGADALTDLAVLSIDDSYASGTLAFGDSDSIRPGDDAWAIGNPLGLDFSRTVTEGIISATDRNVTVDTSDGEWELEVIQTDAAINPGNSGGALLNTNGEVIGISSMKISESGVEGLGFAIPSNDVIPIANELIKNGKITRPYLGVSLANVEEIPEYYLRDIPDAAKSGVMITGVENNSAADKAGLQQEDIIVAIDGIKITSSAELRKQLYTKKSGDKVKLTLYRGTKKKTVSATLQE